MEVTDCALPVDDPSDVGEVRRETERLLDGRFDATAAGRSAILATELASNLVKHAGGGQVVVRVIGDRSGGRSGLELLAIDHGRGMDDVERCFADGYSTAGSPGTGLGAVRRLSACVEVDSGPNGTVLLARQWGDGGPDTPPAWGGASIPCDGHRANGDAWLVTEEGGRTLLAVADGLGHGPEAEVAGRLAIEIVRDLAAHPLDRILRDVHAALRSTRGAVLALTRLDPTAGAIEHAGAGNILTRVFTPDDRPRTLVTHDGTLGHALRTVQVSRYPLPREGVLISHSDGIQARSRPETWPGLCRRSPTLLAGMLLRDHRRPSDDATAAVVSLDRLR